MEKAIKKYFPIFALPTLLAFMIGFIVPFVYGIFLSFCKFTTVTDWKWIGFKNYTRIFFVNGKLDTTFLHSIWYTCLFTLVTVLVINVVAFAIAMALTKGIRGTNVFRTAFFLPNLIGGIVLSYVWLMIFNAILQKYDMTIVTTQWTAFWGLVAVVAWQQIGYMMIIYIAGLQAIPEDMLEAAKIDGASGWKTLWNITIPNVMPSITICTFLSLTNGFKLYDQNLALTGGSPFKTLADGNVIKTTEMLALNIVNSNTSNSKGPGQAKAVVFFILVAIISIAQLVSTRKKEVDQ